jgi:hypothetical protein
MMLATTEGCTGGLIAVAPIVEAKAQLLGVPAELIGAASDDCPCESGTVSKQSPSVPRSVRTWLARQPSTSLTKHHKGNQGENLRVVGSISFRLTNTFSSPKP